MYHVAADGVIIASTDTAHGTADVFEYLGSAVKSGAKVTVHYTDDAGKKVAHAFKHL